MRNQKTGPDEFAHQAEGRSRGMFAEFFAFLAHNKKWWLLPTVLFLLAAAGLVILGGTSMAPLIYTLF